ncbi:MAG: hypothetical protein RLZZ58_324 [Pseudomonadota bacterium]|jgi:uncharacterized protein YbjT (DUF2867 family)
MLPTLAVTGATGFVGGHLLDKAAVAGWRVRALTRRAQPDRSGVSWIDGALDRPDSLAALVQGADAVLHIAGVVNAPDRAGFEAGNVHGTLAVVEAAKAAGVRRFVHVSSLAAREPDLSVYGWSKARAEVIVQASGLDWTMVRPPAIFGPGDTEMFDLFRMAKHGVALLPPAGRMSAIFVRDLADLLLSLAADQNASIGATFEADDGRPNGWAHATFAKALGRAFGRAHVSTLAVPELVLRLAARADGMVRRKAAKLTPDRARYIAHPDWVVTDALRPPADLWRAATPTPDALRATADWYRANGWL